MQFNQRSKSQAQPIRIGFREELPQGLIEDKSRFEIRTRQRVFDPANAMAKVEAFRALFGSRQQPLQPSPKIGSLGYVRFRVGVFAAQEEDGGRGGHGRENMGVCFGPELNALGQHVAIVDEVGEVRG